MAVYRNLKVGYWQDDFILDLTLEERYFYIYLLTCSKTTQCGIYSLPKRLAEMETGFSSEMIGELLKQFIDYGKILYDAQTNELYILNWVRHNSITNTNVEKCVLRELKDVKSKKFVHIFLQKCIEEGLNISLLLKHFGMPADIPEEISESSEADEKEEKIASDCEVFTFYEQNFDSLSQYAREELHNWINDLSEELVLKALQIAYENNKRTLAYVKGILRDWQKKGYTKLSEVEEAALKFRKKEPLVVNDTKQFLEECEEWEKNVPSEEELQQFLQDQGWQPWEFRISRLNRRY
ncbi:DnaD domain-containing protein [Microbacteriaceae bacterium 4G12]